MEHKAERFAELEVKLLQMRKLMDEEIERESAAFTEYAKQVDAMIEDIHDPDRVQRLRLIHRMPMAREYLKIWRAGPQVRATLITLLRRDIKLLHDLKPNIFFVCFSS